MLLDRCGQTHAAVFNWGVPQSSDCGRRHWRPRRVPWSGGEGLLPQKPPRHSSRPPVLMLQVARSRQDVRFDKPGNSFDFVEFPLSKGSLTLSWHLELLVACVCFFSLSSPFASPYAARNTFPPWRVPRLRDSCSWAVPHHSASLCPFSSHLPIVSRPPGFTFPFFVSALSCPESWRSGQTAPRSPHLPLGQQPPQETGIVDRYDLHKSAHVSGCLIAWRFS